MDGLPTVASGAHLTGRPLITCLRSATARQADHSVRAGFTLVELLIVIASWVCCWC